MLSTADSPCLQDGVMHAIEIAGLGGPEMLRMTTRPMPVPRPGQVLLEVAAAGVNRPDVMQRTGQYPAPPGASDLPGLEVSGTVIATGEGVTDLAIGARVTALVAGGGYASHCIAEAPLCLPVPDTLSMIEAAAMPENWFTVWDHIVRTCRLARDETILIHGGSSGIGIAAIQLAQSLGARAYATAGSEEKIHFLDKLGCVQSVNYKTEDFVSVLKAATEGKGIDVIIDMVAGSYLARNIDLLADRGRISIIGALDTIVSNGIRIDQIMIKQAIITGNTLRPKPLSYKAEIANGLRTQVWPLVEAGQIKPVIDSVFPLEQAAAAHRLMESSTHIGKIVLVPTPLPVK